MNSPRLQGAAFVVAAGLLAALPARAVAAESGIELGEPAVVVLAPASVRDWGPYQFPSLERLPDGRLCVSIHVEADSALAYGLPCLQAVSTDAGRTWSVLPKDGPEAGRIPSFSYALELPGGERLVMQRPSPLKAADLALPARPFGQCTSYGASLAFYRIADLPPECNDGWLLERFSPGKQAPTREKATVRLPGELRYTIDGVMPLPWYTGHRMRVAPDGAVWCFGEDRRDVGGVFDRQARIIVMRSADRGRTFDLWSEIPYAPDPSADPKADQRDGFTEPGVIFMPDKTALCLLRTEDGNGTGPLYQCRSTDNGKTWSKPEVFDDRGVWPELLTLGNGVTLAAYGRPGLYLRSTSDPAGRVWNPRAEVVPAGRWMQDTCSYAALLPVSNDTALIAYSKFDVPGPDGTPRKAILVRTVRATPGPR